LSTRPRPVRALVFTIGNIGLNLLTQPNQFADLANFLFERLSGKNITHFGFDDLRRPAKLALRVTFNVIYPAVPTQSRVHEQNS
jgi:hypothetical protein